MSARGDSTSAAFAVVGVSNRRLIESIDSGTRNSDEHNRFATRAAFAFGQGIDRARLIVEVERVAVKQRKPNNTYCNILQG